MKFFSSRLIKSVFQGAFVLSAALSAGSSFAHDDVLNVCYRTAPVKAFLERALTKACADITDEDLATIKRVAVPNAHVEAFQVGDFSGLPNLEILNIKGNPITSLPEGLMQDLPKLKTIVLFDTPLAQLPEDFLEGMPLLENIHVFSNPFTTAPEAVIERMLSLEHIQVIDFNDALDSNTKAVLRERFPVGGPVELNFF